MSWSITLCADRPIEESHVLRVLSVPGKDLSKFPLRQDWGWPTSTTGFGVDVFLPEGRKLMLCGGEFNAHLADEAAENMANGLRRLGYTISNVSKWRLTPSPFSKHDKPVKSNDVDPEALAKRLEALRVECIFEQEINLPPMAEQYYLLAIGAIEQAQRYAKLAHYHLMQGK